MRNYLLPTTSEHFRWFCLEANLSNNQEKGYLASESFQLKLSTVTKGIFQQ